MSLPLLPLPSLIRASAQDAGSRAMRAAGRKVWSEGDRDAAVDMFDKLVDSCFGEGREGRYLFQVAERLERDGRLCLSMKPAQMRALVEEAA